MLMCLQLTAALVVCGVDSKRGQTFASVAARSTSCCQHSASPVLLLLLQYDQKGPTVLAALAYMVHLSIKETSPASGGSEGTVAGERRRGRPKSIQKMEVKQATGTQATPAPAASVPTSQPLVHGVTEGPHDSSAVLTSGGGAVSNQQPPCGGPATYWYISSSLLA
jgi:hypothetical protein